MFSRGGAIGAEEILGIEAGEVQDGFPHGLAGDGAGIDADAADGALLFDDRDALSGLRSLDGRTLASRPGANNDQIIGLHWNRPESRR